MNKILTHLFLLIVTVIWVSPSDSNTCFTFSWRFVTHSVYLMMSACSWFCNSLPTWPITPFYASWCHLNMVSSACLNSVISSSLSVCGPGNSIASLSSMSYSSQSKSWLSELTSLSINSSHFFLLSSSQSSYSSSSSSSSLASPTSCFLSTLRLTKLWTMKQHAL